MSGKDDPVAFFPSIDRNLLRDLDRHFMSHRSDMPSEIVLDEEALATPSVEEVEEAGTVSVKTPTAENLVVAVQRTAAALTERSDRIEELERELNAAPRARAAMAVDLEEARRLLQASGDALQGERQRRDQAEALATRHLDQVAQLETQLAKALDDFNLVADAIAAVALP